MLVTVLALKCVLSVMTLIENLTIKILLIVFFLNVTD